MNVLLELLRSLLFFLGRISGHGSFPHPIPPAEERAALEALAEGDESACNKLVEHNLRLVAHIAKKYHVTSLDQDDLISIGTMGLIKAVRTYKLSSGTSLATYAARCIENEILMALRASRKYRDEVSLSDPIGTDRDGKDIDLIDVLGSDPDLVEREVTTNTIMERVHRLIGTQLTDRERVVIKLRYGLADQRCVPQREIAAMLGISRSYVSRIEKKALEKLADALEKPEDSFAIR